MIQSNIKRCWPMRSRIRCWRKSCNLFLVHNYSTSRRLLVRHKWWERSWGRTTLLSCSQGSCACLFVVTFLQRKISTFEFISEQIFKFIIINFRRRRIQQSRGELLLIACFFHSRTQSCFFKDINRKASTN